MRKIAGNILTTIIIFCPYTLAFLAPPPHKLYYIASPILLISILIFNRVVGAFAWSRPYFMSRYNILSSQVRHQQEFDLPKQLLFEKLMEAIPVIGLEIKYADEKNGNIFATQRKSWASWGENIYLSLTEVNDKTTLDFCSAGIFSGWAFSLSDESNERNYKDLMQEIEKSLII
jgi:hypothetical protein